MLNWTFTYIGKHRLINDEAYTAYVYRPSQLSQCEGELYVVPMYRNAEAIALLTRLSGLKPGRVFYLLGKTWYGQFPTAQFWMQRLIKLLARVMHQDVPAPIVYGIFAPFGCGDLFYESNPGPVV